MMKDFLIEKVVCKEAFDWTEHHHAFVNPYNGCTAGCPYCFWLSQNNWENRIQIRENIVDMLDAALDKWNPNEFVYLGSVCDPFMELEKEWRLSLQCLEVIKKHGIPILITTSALNTIVREYTGLLKSMKQRVIIVVELSRLAPLREYNANGVHVGIENANYLYAQGLEVWTTVSPVLPGITSLDSILRSLNPEIPIYVDSLRCEKDSVQAKKVMAWISAEYPQLEREYHSIVINQDSSYFDNMLVKYMDEKRIRTFPFDLN